MTLTMTVRGTTVRITVASDNHFIAWFEGQEFHARTIHELQEKLVAAVEQYPEAGMIDVTDSSSMGWSQIALGFALWAGARLYMKWYEWHEGAPQRRYEREQRRKARQA